MERSWWKQARCAPFLPLLLCLGAALLPAGRTRSHSLRYFTTGVSRPGPGVSEFTSVGYVDDVQFVRFDGDGRRGRAEPRTPWIRDNEGREYWDQETEIFRSGAQNFHVGLQNIMGYYNQSEERSHTVQGLYGCQLREDNTPGEGFMQFGYDGRDYIALDKATLSWTVADAGALNTKSKWEADGTIAERYKAYLEDECIEWLRRYMGFGGPCLTRADPPKVDVIRHPGPDGEDVSLRCRAFGFYPADIKFMWRREGEDVSLQMELVDTRPSGDGNFQKWASVSVPRGEELKYVCVVEHEGLAQPLAVKWVPDTSLSNKATVGVMIVILLIPVAVVGFVIWKRSGPRGGN
ncbi:H-2 class I histocompatibility antigen, Q10 alpha chain-like [Ornithorhynchus anatinus]|uniref:H-2 class I histocompatibility antigen, Q10 alpha chain-like n=1 Tax=Ornithorhynchus anatinus TaxID=9258 RepID=UPI0010A8C06B|nr:H-2 class I histocompatibility antigen, Q10 alpha chain-like [Ornithorhynchus anatinus]